MLSVKNYCCQWATESSEYFLHGCVASKKGKVVKSTLNIGYKNLCLWSICIIIMNIALWSRVFFKTAARDGVVHRTVLFRGYCPSWMKQTAVYLAKCQMVAKCYHNVPREVWRVFCWCGFCWVWFTSFFGFFCFCFFQKPLRIEMTVQYCLGSSVQ